MQEHRRRDTIIDHRKTIFIGESILKRVAEDESVISMANIELVQYLIAMRSATISENSIENYSDTELWFEKEGKIFSVKPGEKYILH